MTRRPSASVARWVTPIEAAARGSSSKVANSSLMGAPSSSSIRARTTAAGKLGADERNSANSSVSTVGSRSSRVEAI